jgi:predicted DNA binding protein
MDDSIVSRFEKYIDKSGECWLWTGYCNNNGYGKFRYDGENWYSHRFAYFLANGELPASPLIVRHKCRSRNCVNPDHLESGTPSENQLDRVRDETDIRGAKHPNSKLTEEQVREIQKRHDEKVGDLAKEFSVAHQTISEIIKKKRWAWLE